MDIWSSHEAAMEYAKNLAKATLGAVEFRNASNVLMAMEIGRSYGLSPAVSMMNIHIIPTSKGPTPALTANMMQSLAVRAGHFIKVESTTKSRAVGKLIRGDMTPERRQYLLDLGMTLDDIRDMISFSEMWDEGRAADAGLLGKGNWGLYPQSMMRARVKADLVRMACPEVLMGNMYTPDELGALVDEEGLPLMDGGEVLMGEVVRAAPTRTSRKTSAAKKAAPAPEPEPVDAEIEEDEEQAAPEAEEAAAEENPVDPQQVVDYALTVAQDESVPLQERAETLGFLLKQSDEFELGDSEISVGDSEATLREALLAISKPIMVKMHQQAKQAATA